MKCRLVNDEFIDNYTVNLLKSRGVDSMQEFIEPHVGLLQDAADLDNIKEGADLFLHTIANNGKILIVVDSDNDGYTSGAMMYLYTKRLAPNIQIDYVLHNGKQHGLEDHIDGLISKGHFYDLIILPDASSNDFVHHERLKEINTPCLILDHHLVDTKISDNAIIINNQSSPKYHNKELTGAGIVYQFCRYLDARCDRDWADDYLDLAAWGIIGDMASVLEMENRYIIKEGLSNINNKFLWALMHKQGYSITGTVGPTNEQLIAAMNPISVAFYIVPLVNAMIRMGTPEEKQRLFEAFLDGDKMVPSNKRGAKGTLDRAGNEAARECTNARSRQNKTLEKAVEAIEIKIHKYGLLDNKILFVRLEDDDDFPAELNGLVAMKLSQKFKKPTIIARLNRQGYDRGSMRGLNQSELTSFKAFLESSDLFEYVAGHDNAAGISIQDDKLRKFHAFANAELQEIDFGENVYDVNFIRNGNSVDLQALIADIADYNGIWGQQNSTPLIYVKDIIINSSDFQVIGRNKDTLKFEKNGITYIKFFAKELIAQIQSLQGEVRVEAVGEANMNEWNGRFTPQIMMKDCHFKASSLTDF